MWRPPRRLLQVLLGKMTRGYSKAVMAGMKRRGHIGAIFRV